MKLRNSLDTTMGKAKQTEVAIKEGEIIEPMLPMQQSAEFLIAKAIEKNVPVETLERLLAMRKELMAEKAKKEFDQSMADFQGECPIIKKTKSVKTKAGVKAYNYAPLESIVEQTKILLQKYGFSYSNQTETNSSLVKATCTAKHIGGHSESTSIELPLGERTQIMSATQVVAAALTFAKRYAFCNAFGILTVDEDTDASETRTIQTTVPQNLQSSVGIISTPKQAIRNQTSKPANQLIVWQHPTGAETEKRCVQCGWYFIGTFQKCRDCYFNRPHAQMTKKIINDDEEISPFE